MCRTIAEALVSLGFLAARTSRLELGVSALVVAQRQPLVALKQLTTLDFLSGGRIVTAVAAGWMEREFATLGASYERRGQLLNEWLSVASSVFDQMPGRVRYEGDAFAVDGWLPQTVGTRHNRPALLLSPPERHRSATSWGQPLCHGREGRDKR